MLKQAAAVALAGILLACAGVPHRDAAVMNCEQAFAQSDARIARSGAADHAAERIPGYDYLRTTRFLASLAGAAAASEQAFSSWIEGLREQDLSLREVELANAGAGHAEWAALDRCGRALAAHDSANAVRRAELLNAIGVPSDYSAAGRLLGLYPFAVPFMKLGIRGFHDDVEKDYARPAENLDSPGPLLEYPPPPAPPVPPAGAAAWAATWIGGTDALGVPQLHPQQWRQLLADHAPVWIVETADDYDRLGRIVTRRGQPALDPAEPAVYTLTGFTHFRGQVLPQLIYVAWFSERPPRGRFDPYAGWLDGVIWRVTLGADGKPLVYDSIHACGCYHYFFPVASLALRQSGGFWEERVLAPQGAVPPGPVALRLQSGTHYLRRVLPAGAAGMRHASYRLLPYRDLQQLPDGRGGTRSLFGRDGLVAGSERAERWWLWPSGVVSPGTMRQYGRHATAFIGTRHFDDPGLLDDLFPAGN